MMSEVPREWGERSCELMVGMGAKSSKKGELVDSKCFDGHFQKFPV